MLFWLLETLSRQPLPQSSATSANAWSALLRSHLSNVEPNINQWRGTLDTLLIFVSGAIYAGTDPRPDDV